MRSAVSRPRDFLASPAWTCTLARLRREYDLILVDGGPLFTGLSAAVLHRSVDAAVLVSHRGMTGERAILRAREVLGGGGRAASGFGRDVRLNSGGGPVYEAHFGLKHRPFGETVSPSAYVARSQPRHRVASAALRAGARPGTGSALRSARHRQDAAGTAAGERAGRSGDPCDLPGPLRRRDGGASR